ncbi:MAG: glutamyl-tRNA reductase [Syntrophales bacterium]|nr:glutamyl-tRNA reductase [Syntrophales bacterium]
MDIILAGLNHRTAPVEIRERLNIALCEENNPLEFFKEKACISEVLCLITCNRVEILATTEKIGEAESVLKHSLLQHTNLLWDDLFRCVYVYYNEEAVRHLFRVASSLDSMIVGEPQILGQVKDAYRAAVEHGTAGVLLNRILHHAFRTAKRVRSETGIANNAVSVSFAAVQLAKKIFGRLKGKTVLVIGAGEMSELTVRHLMKNGADSLIITNRTYERAVELARVFGGEVFEFSRIGEALEKSDIVISSTGAPGFLISRDIITSVMRNRRHRLLFIIDIAVPRDVDPNVGLIDNVFLFNIDDLQEIADENMNIRREEATKAERIVEEEVEKFRKWFNSLDAVPTIVALRRKVESIVEGELARASSWLKSLEEKDRQEVDILIRSIINKVLHDPMVALKEMCYDRAGKPYVAAVRRIFRLQEEEDEK